VSPVAEAVIGLGNVPSGKSVTPLPHITVLGLPAGYSTNQVAVIGLPHVAVYVPVSVAVVAVMFVTVVVPAHHIIGAVGNAVKSCS
jgi:hypothetical protein